MRKILLLFIFAFTIQLANAQQNVTINVDISDVENFNPETHQLDWAGAFDEWFAFHTLTKTNDSIYSITFQDVEPGYYGGDVYHNDKGAPAWGTYGEWSGGPTGIDIMVYVGNEDVELTTKWGETYDLTVSVDMNNVEDFTAGTDNVYLLSKDVDFNQTQMTDDNSDGIYSITISDVPSGHYPTVFAFGPDAGNLTPEWDYVSEKGNRVIEVNGEDTDVAFSYTTGGITPTGNKVTINVDMSGVDDFDPETRQLDWAGGFDGWAAFYSLTKTDDNIYSVTFSNVASGYYGGDVYHNDKGSPAWGTYGEWSAGPTGVDIMVYVGDEDVELTTKWGETYDLTVSVDMNNTEGFTPGADNVYLISNDVKFNQTQMTDDNSDGIYSVTINDVPSGHFPTVFAFGPDTDNLTPEWDYETEKGKRVIKVNGENTDVAFSFTSGETPPDAGKKVTINVNMNDVADFDPEAHQLDWAGAFDEWAAFHTLTKTNDSIYSITFSDVSSGYYAGDVYHNDKGSPAWGTYGEWSAGPSGVDIMVYVGDEDVELTTKWGETYDLTVSVDMNAVEGFNAGVDNVYLMSNEVNFNRTQMTDNNSDGIYSVTISGVPSGHFPTVFAFGPDTDNLTAEWDYETDKGNRVIKVNGENTDVAFSYGVGTHSSPAGKKVTINVNISSIADFDPEAHQLDWAGAFDEWAEFHTLTKTNDSIYSVTFSEVQSGYYAGDVYHNDLGSPAWGTYGEWSGGPTGVDIMVYVGDEDVELTTKWDETFEYTVEVNMNNVDGFNTTTDKVYLISDDIKYHNSEMTDEDNDGIYSVVLSGIPYGHFPLIFAYGPDAENITSEWDYENNKGRRVMVVDGSMTKATYDFASSELVVGIHEFSNSPELLLYPNPVTGNSIKFKINGAGWTEGSVKLIDLTGRVLQQKYINSNNGSLNISTLKSGVYVFYLSNGNTVTTKKFIVH